MTRAIGRVRRAFYDNALWVVGLGLMLASSGIDGAYMARWNTWPWAGFLLNTVADVGGMAIAYYYGVLVQDTTKKKRRLARLLLGAEVVAVLYSWFFSWRQLLLVMPGIEGQDARWVAPISAAFVPLLLAFVGLAQSLINEPPEREQDSQPARNQAQQARASEMAPAPISQEDAKTKQGAQQGADDAPQDETKAACVARVSATGDIGALEVAQLCNCSRQYAQKLMKEAQE